MESRVARPAGAGMFGEVALDLPLLLEQRVEDALARRCARRPAGTAAAWIWACSAGELPLLGGDLVARGLDPVVGRLELVDEGGDLVAQAADPGDDLVVVVLDVVEVLGPGEQVRPVGGAHDDRGHVRLVRLVDVDQQLLERGDRRLQLGADPRELRLLGVELRRSPGRARPASARAPAGPRPACWRSCDSSPDQLVDLGVHRGRSGPAAGPRSTGSGRARSASARSSTAGSPKALWPSERAEHERDQHHQREDGGAAARVLRPVCGVLVGVGIGSAPAARGRGGRPRLERSGPNCQQLLTGRARSVAVATRRSQPDGRAILRRRAGHHPLLRDLRRPRRPADPADHGPGDPDDRLARGLLRAARRARASTSSASTTATSAAPPTSTSGPPTSARCSAGGSAPSSTRSPTWRRTPPG